MAIEVVDSGSPRSDYPTIKANGYDGVIRYLAASGDWRRLSPAELAACHAVGLKMGIVHEVNRGERLALGAPAGAADGRQAKPLLDELAWPTWRPCYCASDVDMQESQYQAGLEYVLAHARETGRLPGVYGESGLGAYCEARGVHFSWNANATSWSNTANPNAELQQEFSARPPINGTDENFVWQGDWGGWLPGMVATNPEEDLMAATLEQVQQEFSNLDARIKAFMAPFLMKIDAVLVNVDPVGVAAGSPGAGPSYLRSDVGALLAIAQGQSGAVDVTALAAALTASLSKDMAKQLADELARRLQG